MPSNALATRTTQAIATAVTDWELIWQQANAFVQSGFLPESIKTAEQAIAIIKTGEELGLPPMLSLRSIHVIKGKPTLSADLMASLVQREIDRRGDGVLMVLPPTAAECTVNYRRWGWAEGQSYTYTIADATRAGLLANQTWKAHPAAMLRARATAAVCRMAFPDVIAGLYAPEELDVAPVDGEVRLAPNVTVLPREATAGDTGVEQDTEPEASAEVVNQQTGEIETIDGLHAEIKSLRNKLGWSSQDVVSHAKELGIPLTHRDGLREMRDQLQKYVTEEEVAAALDAADSPIDADSRADGSGEEGL